MIFAYINPKPVVKIFNICRTLLVYFPLTSRAFSELNNKEGGGKEAKEDAKMKNSIMQIGKGDISRPNDRFRLMVLLYLFCLITMAI